MHGYFRGSLGLHPSAQRKMAEILPEIARKKKIQIIISSHSEYIIDNLPRESRILIERGTEEHLTKYMPSTRSALGSLTNDPLAELKIFCEDEFAKSLIQNSLPQDIRKRVTILSMGSDSELLSHVAHHAKSGEKHKTLIIWDGEVSLKKIKDWHKNFNLQNPETHVNFTRLPGDVPPESWIIEQIISTPHAVSKITEQFTISDDSETLDILYEAKTNLDHHSLQETFSKRTNTTQESAKERIILAATTLFSEKFIHIKNLTKTILDS